MYRLIAKDTIEEAMLHCAQSKLRLERDMAAGDNGKYWACAIFSQGILHLEAITRSIQLPDPLLCQCRGIFRGQAIFRRDVRASFC